MMNKVHIKTSEHTQQENRQTPQTETYDTKIQETDFLR